MQTGLATNIPAQHAVHSQLLSSLHQYTSLRLAISLHTTCSALPTGRPPALLRTHLRFSRGALPHRVGSPARMLMELVQKMTSMTMYTLYSRPSSR